MGLSLLLCPLPSSGMIEWQGQLAATATAARRLEEASPRAAKWAALGWLLSGRGRFSGDVGDAGVYHSPHKYQSSLKTWDALSRCPRPPSPGRHPPHMQQPTLHNVRVRSTRDALQIFYAVARGVLPMITRRLDAEERRAIVPGNVYIWEERCANAEITGLGMERWTDGISWSASRIAQEFLFYRQRDSDQDSAHPSNQWAQIMRRRDPRSSSSPRSEVDRLIKQTYSVHVSLPEDRPRGLTRKWHLTAYFSQATLDSLNTIDNIPGVGDVQVPQGWFKNARASKARQGDSHRDDDNSSPLQDPWASVEPMTTTFRAQFSLDDDDKRRWTSNVAPPPPSLPHDRRSDFPPAHPPLRPPTTGISHPGRPPTEPGRDYYRDPSPFTSQSSSSTSSEVDASPRTFSAPTTPPVPASFPHVQVAQHQTTPDRNLVPLAVLTSIRQPVRDPIAEDCLRRLSGTPRLEHRWQESRTTLPP